MENKTKYIRYLDDIHDIHDRIITDTKLNRS